jgi:2-haloacid dehalogenase
MNVKALVFDVFGTVVDWRSSIIREGKDLDKAKGLAIDWEKFALAWRAGYSPMMNRVRNGELPWTKIDVLHRLILDKILMEFRIASLTEQEKQHLNLVWHRLDPWPDSVSGLTRLKRKFVISTLSNGNTALLVNMAKHAGLPWDAVLSSDLALHFKPDPEVYLMASDQLGVPPAQLLMVAAHKSDLQAAHKVGLKTAFVPRPLEYGPGGNADLVPDSEFDLVARDFNDLAGKLGA